MKTKALQAFKRRTQVVSLIIFAWASIVPVGGISASSLRLKSQPVISVGVYNYAGVARPELRVAERQAAHLFATAGVRIAWMVYSQKQSAGQPQHQYLGTDFVVRILPPSMSARCNHKPAELGQSLVPAGVHGPTPGGIANVFYDRVEHVSSLWGLFRGDVLGVAVAHELGHLLLGPEHSHRGIMKADWTSRDLELASRGGLQFSARQLSTLQRTALSLRRDT